MKKFSMFLFVVSLFVVLGSSAYANLIVNGSFEVTKTYPLNEQAYGTWTIYNSIPGWVSNDYGIEVRDHVAGVAQEGSNFVELDGNRNGSMYQFVNTVAGQKYILSYYYAPREGVAAESNGIELFFNNFSLGTMTGANEGWKQISFTVAGTGFDEVKFAAIGKSDSYGGSIDNVSMVQCQVPEPSFLLLAGMGLIGLAGVKVMFGKK